MRARLLLVVPLSVGLHFVSIYFSDLPDPETQELHTLSCPGLCDRFEDDNVAWFTFAEPAQAALDPEVLPEPEVTPPEPEPEDPPREEPEPLPDNYYLVHLPNPEEVEPPEDTPYLAEDNNRTDQEVQAEITTTREVESGEEQPGAVAALTPDNEESNDEGEEAPTDGEEERLALAEDASGEPGGEVVDMGALARSSTGAAPLVGPNPNSPSLPDSGQGLDLTPFNPSLDAYRQSRMAADDLGERERIARHVHHDGYLGGDDEAEWERTRAALENMVPEVRSGTETRLNTRRHEYAEYLSYVHRRIHEMWADDYLMRLDLDFDPFDPLSDPDLEAILELVIGRNGEVARVNIVETSGITEFDGEAIAVAFGIGPLRPPPNAILSDNGNAYLHWTFWRDQRQCGTFGASVHRVQ